MSQLEQTIRAFVSDIGLDWATFRTNALQVEKLVIYKVIMYTYIPEFCKQLFVMIIVQSSTKVYPGLPAYTPC